MGYPLVFQSLSILPPVFCFAFLYSKCDGNQDYDSHLERSPLTAVLVTPSSLWVEMVAIIHLALG